MSTPLPPPSPYHGHMPPFRPPSASDSTTPPPPYTPLPASTPPSRWPLPLSTHASNIFATEYSSPDGRDHKHFLTYLLRTKYPAIATKLLHEGDADGFTVYKLAQGLAWGRLCALIEHEREMESEELARARRRRDPETVAKAQKAQKARKRERRRRILHKVCVAGTVVLGTLLTLWVGAALDEDIDKI